MSPYQKEQLANIRRAAEAALKYGHEDHTWLDYISTNTDTLNHILNLVELMQAEEG